MVRTTSAVCVLLPSLVDSILEAVFTVSPNKQYRGILVPTTPATTAPVKEKKTRYFLFLNYIISLVASGLYDCIAYIAFFNRTKSECQYCPIWVIRWQLPEWQRELQKGLKGECWGKWWWNGGTVQFLRHLQNHVSTWQCNIFRGSETGIPTNRNCACNAH